MKIIMHSKIINGKQAYRNFDCSYCLSFEGEWILRKDGNVIDQDSYRGEICDRNSLELTYSRDELY